MAPRGRPRTRPASDKYESMMFRWPPAVAKQLRDMAHDEERSINTVVFRLLREGLKAEGKEIATPHLHVDTAYSS